MIHRLLRFVGIAACSAPAWAHFPFLVPVPDRTQARIVMSETLEADARVPADLVLGGTYSARLAQGELRPMSIETTSDGPTLALTGEFAAATALFGSVDLGVNQRKDGKPHVLVYYAKTLLGNPFDAAAASPSGAPIEIVPLRAEGGVRLRLVVDGAPAPDAELTVLLPDGTEREVTTGSDGASEALQPSGRYGAWARHWLTEAGSRDGKAYEEVRRYATLVFDFDSNPPSASAARATTARRGHAAPRPPQPIVSATAVEAVLPEATSSFGAVQSDGWVYVYGGHIVETHRYDTSAVSGRFSRIDLGASAVWEDLPAGPPLQGMNLAAFGGMVYRVGGMEPRNAPGEKTDNWSVKSAARFDPASRQWEELPPLPAPRSSHDVAIIDNKLYVVGGWDMAGAQGNTWPTSMVYLDLHDVAAGWRELPQPFQRRALIAAVHDNKLFVFGGFDPNDDPSRRVDIFDPREGRWSQGPGLPGGSMNGFAPAACQHDRQLYVSLGDGSIHRLDEDEFRWEQVATNKPRIVHRMLSIGARIFVLGGASEGQNHALIESIAPPPAEAAAARAAQIEREAANRSLARRAIPSRAGVEDVRSEAAGTAVSMPAIRTSAVIPAASPSPAPKAPSPSVLAAAAVQKFCPIMTDEPVDATSYAVEYSGETVLLCCKSCLRKWNKNAELYASSANLPQLARKVSATDTKAPTTAP